MSKCSGDPSEHKNTLHVLKHCLVYEKLSLYLLWNSPLLSQLPSPNVKRMSCPTYVMHGILKHGDTFCNDFVRLGPFVPIREQ